MCSSDLGALPQQEMVSIKGGALPQREMVSIKGRALPQPEMGSINCGCAAVRRSGQYKERGRCRKEIRAVKN